MINRYSRNLEFWNGGSPLDLYTRRKCLGIGRVMVPPQKKCFHKGVDPFTYNPVTGTNTVHGVSIPTLPAPTTGGSVPGYIPGGDDTPVPNPGFEVPTGALPSPPARH